MQFSGRLILACIAKNGISGIGVWHGKRFWVSWEISSGAGKIRRSRNSTYHKNCLLPSIFIIIFMTSKNSIYYRSHVVPFSLLGQPRRNPSQGLRSIRNYLSYQAWNVPILFPPLGLSWRSKGLFYCVERTRILMKFKIQDRYCKYFQTSLRFLQRSILFQLIHEGFRLGNAF